MKKLIIASVPPKEILLEINYIIESFMKSLEEKNAVPWKVIQHSIITNAKKGKAILMPLKNIDDIIKHAQISRAVIRANTIRFEMEIYEMIGMPIPKRYEDELNILYHRLVKSPFKQKTALISQMKKQFLGHDNKHSNSHKMKLLCNCKTCSRDITVPAEPLINMVKEMGIYSNIYKTIIKRVKNGIITLPAGMLYELINNHQELLAYDKAYIIKFELEFCVMMKKPPTDIMIAEFDMVINDIKDELIKAKLKNIKEICCDKIGI